MKSEVEHVDHLEDAELQISEHQESEVSLHWEQGDQKFTDLAFWLLSSAVEQKVAVFRRVLVNAEVVNQEIEKDYCRVENNNEPFGLPEEDQVVVLDVVIGEVARIGLFIIKFVLIDDPPEWIEDRASCVVQIYDYETEKECFGVLCEFQVEERQRA